MKTQLFIPEKWSQTNMEELSYNYYDKWIIEKNEKTIEDILDDLPIEVIEKYLRKKKLEQINNVRKRSNIRK